MLRQEVRAVDEQTGIRQRSGLSGGWVGGCREGGVELERSGRWRGGGGAEPDDMRAGAGVVGDRADVPCGDGEALAGRGVNGVGGHCCVVGWEVGLEGVAQMG